ncbi:hypothetical protein FHL15_010597 [Xylaria flabelliformis]|uniref:Uncharacterized protein n=1 Tax=Xylaria flabelliformis TaxID=2512241 RepID=A0A553HKK0_9PEZI|nr:hypothetical protein FHL15_010597 [Xylaria flabelliformis]
MDEAKLIYASLPVGRCELKHEREREEEPTVPYKLHRWNRYSDSKSDQDLLRRYPYTTRKTCREPSGILDILQRRSATWCMLRCERSDNQGWGGGVTGYIRWKGCRNPKHIALAVRRGIDTTSFPNRWYGHRTRLPENCGKRRSSHRYPYGGEEVVDIPEDNYYPPHVRVSDWGGWRYAPCHGSMVDDIMGNDPWRVNLRGGSRDLKSIRRRW